MGAYELAQEDFSAGVARAAEKNVDADMYGQALIWEVLKMYAASGPGPGGHPFRDPVHAGQLR